MAGAYNQNSEQVIIALRRVIRAVDLHSRSLARQYGLTGPQALLLKSLQNGALSAGAIAQRLSLSQATITDVMKRLEKRGLIVRNRDMQDRRRAIIELTHEGHQLLQSSPPLLQERFVNRFASLAEWEQTQLLSSLQRIASMMDAEEIDAAPVLSSGHVRADAEIVGEALDPAKVSCEPDN